MGYLKKKDFSFILPALAWTLSIDLFFSVNYLFVFLVKGGTVKCMKVLGGSPVTLAQCGFMLGRDLGWTRMD